MTLAVAVQHLRDQAEEEVPLSNGGAQRQTNYRLLAQSLDPRSLLASNMELNIWTHVILIRTWMNIRTSGTPKYLELEKSWLQPDKPPPPGTLSGVEPSTWTPTSLPRRRAASRPTPFSSSTRWFGEMVRWGDGEMLSWWDGEMVRWWDGELARWWYGEMARWCSVQKTFHDDMDMTNTTNKLTVEPFYN